MSRHAELLRLAMSADLPIALPFSEALTRARLPTSALVVEWRSPLGHVVLVEPTPEGLRARMRSLVARVAAAHDLHAWSFAPELFVVAASRLLESRTLSPDTLEAMALELPSGEPVGEDGWLLIEAGDPAPPASSFLATLLGRRTTAPTVLPREALFEDAIEELEDDEAEEYAEDEGLLVELLADRLEAQETAARDHLASGALRRGLTDVATGTHEP